MSNYTLHLFLRPHKSYKTRTVEAATPGDAIDDLYKREPKLNGPEYTRVKRESDPNFKQDLVDFWEVISVEEVIEPPSD